ncbi:Tubulin binding cofactor C [Novymonas esmeraldas]|uniref:Tubulin binding cofactor C n=1 Tax=Novymonas esmeraldas TaxID=1808958 RepID=A0AAW0EPZ1_9TRYP
MEEKFLKQRLEREEQRHQRSKETAAITAQRQQYEAEAEQLEAEVTDLLQRGNLAESQQRIDTLRTLVQDTANSISLTAHEMAKANGVLARLQQLVDDKNSDAAPKKFKFSSRLKTKATPSDATPTSTSASPSSEPHTVALAGRMTGFGSVYGPSSGGDLFIREGKSAFVNGCVDCTIYCLPIAGSVFLSDCTGCRVYVSCHQLRLKSCARLDLYVWCASTPIIESCDAVRFGPYRCWAGLLGSSAADGRTYVTHAEWVSKVGEIADALGTEHNYTNVDDFQWVKKTASPHWRVLVEDEEQVSTTVFGEPALPSTAPSAHPAVAAAEAARV